MSTEGKDNDSAGRILVVDDEPELLRAYRRQLGRNGFTVETASNGEDAVKAFIAGDFQCIVSDISMPTMDGVQLLRAIRQHDLDVPMILVTGEPSVETAILALDYGAFRYLVKPVEHPELLQTLKSAVHLHRMAEIKREALAMLGSGDMQVGDRAGLEVKFESALEQIYVVYQPIVRWSTRSIIGYEALVRSREPTIPHPGALFDAAERLDRLYDLTRRIRAMAPVPFANNEVTDEVQLFFNLHVRDLNDQVLYDHESGLAKMADRVVLEITERASLNEVRDPHGRVAQLRDIGFKIAVDDLGAGYAGLTSFATLEPDVVKLDMALVRDIHLSSTKRKLVQSMTQLCADMGMSVVAEGVESAEECAALVEAGCDIFQGYFFGKPSMPFADVEFALLPPV